MEDIERIKNVAIYLRKSRNNDGEETEETLQKHRKRLLDIVKKNKWGYELFQEVKSSMDSNRPEYQKMLQKLHNGYFDAVLSVNLARVTRDDAEAPKFMRFLRENEILFITDGERIYNLDIQEDWQALKFTGFINNWEYENIRAQLRKGKKDSAKLGRWSNGVPNFGYIYNRLTKTLEIDEHKAKGVKMAFQLVIDGLGVDNVAIELNNSNFRTNKGNYFHGNSVQRMIRSEIYKGWIVSNRIKGRNECTGKVRPKEQWIVRKNTHEAIIDEETWDLANLKLDARKQLSPRGKQRKHGLSNLIKCYKCGKAHAVSVRKDRNNLKVLQPCKKKNPLGVTCNNRGINYYLMMETIISRVNERKHQLEVVLDEYKERNDPLVDTKSIKLLQLEEHIKMVEKALNKIQILFEEDEIDIIEYRERKSKRTIELNNVKKELAELKDTSKEEEVKEIESTVNILNIFLTDWKLLSEEDLNEGLMTFIEKIVWYYPKGKDVNPKLEIYWKE